ncbi:serine dehydratase subunit alpha family protein [Breznakiella homolactica]|uniref:UPF0597 protein JFL75_05130 n=1 Tax=Breznakiella homolactica TaxID=2798577 RepID=A0A7T7XPT9_9SPIR|nr:L-serine ammonia-lyase, iron-sulfur-dependent, subunit alpha [Breznakiella homolactica]QQO10304.1 L-serine ammonia-lyase, iron-sulfur-dependent, subunit alpha [Breznakiella homolactica]
MDTTAKTFFTGLLKKELITAMGCTEPAAAALAGAAARKELGARPEKITIRASRDIIKNAMHVGIPNTGLKGIAAAAALGISGADPTESLSLLSHVSPEQEAEAAAYLNSGSVRLELAEGVPPIFIEVELEAGGQSACARVRDEHHKVSIVSRGADSAGDKSVDPEKTKALELLKLPLIWEYAGSVPLEDIAFLIDAAKTNLSIAQHSAEKGYGIGVGKAMLREQAGAAPGELFRRGAALAAAASDARMAGCSMPVVINSGSGNQGITIAVPVIVLARGLKKSDEDLARALCLANLTALMVTYRKDRLSALCGAFTAAMGTAAGFIRLLGGNTDDITRAIDNMVGNLTGILCDGAKSSCALKIYSCVEAAAMGVQLALTGRSVPSSEGIIGESMESTLGIIERISHDGMVPLDKTVLEIMLEKGNKR